MWVVNDPEGDSTGTASRRRPRDYAYYSSRSNIDEREAAAELERIIGVNHERKIGEASYLCGRAMLPPESHFDSGATGSYTGEPIARVVRGSGRAAANNRGKKKNKKNRKPKQKYRVRHRK